MRPRYIVAKTTDDNNEKIADNRSYKKDLLNLIYI